MPRPSRRDDVLEAASARFFRDGITATGIDRVIADAGVAKMTLYGNFASKDELVVAYLKHRDRRYFEHVEEEVAAGDTPLERALAPVRLYRRYLDEPGFHGCAFVNAAAELPRGHPGHAVIVEHKERMLARWTELIGELDLAEPELVARECFLSLEGAFVHVGIGSGQTLFDAVEELVRRRLLEAQGPRSAG
jgi:AcrR family transcriptional regulator